MNMHLVRVGLIFLCLSGASAGVAQPWYAGIRCGALALSDNISVPITDAPSSGGAQIGYRFASVQTVTFSLELTGSVSLGDGKVESQNWSYYDGLPVDEAQREAIEDAWSWDVWSVGLYQVARAGDRVYALGKVGVNYENLTVESQIRDESDDPGLSLGIGLGAPLPGGAYVEFEVSSVDQKMAFVGIAAGLGF